MSPTPNTSSPLFERIETLLLAAESGDLLAAEMEELDRLVRDDPHARRFYARYIVETVDLHSWAACADCKATPFSLDSLRATPPIPLGFLGNAAQGAIGYFSQMGPFSYLIATVVMLVMGVVAWSWKIPDYVQVAQDGGQAVSVPVSHDPKVEFVGRITSMVDCQWSDSRTATIDRAYVPLGRKYALASGLMEITYNSGAKVILQGPVTYEVESAAGGFLSQGKLTARVEKKAESGKRKADEVASIPSSFERGAGGEGGEKNGNRSKSQRALTLTLSQGERGPDFFSTFRLPPSALFAVRTPTATVTDLGTEFGVEVTPDGSSETRVFVGSVRCEPTGMGDHARTLTAGQIARIRPDARAVALRDATESDDRRFVRTMPSSENAWHGEVYAELVSKLNPVAYYRMERTKEEVNRDLIRDSAASGSHGQLHRGNALHQSYGRGQFGTALWFGGPGLPDYVVVRDCPKTTTNELSVSVWVYATSRPIWASIAKNWGRMQHGQFFLGLTIDDGDLSVYVQDAEGRDICAREGHSSPLPLECWQHVAFVADGHMLRLYRNGLEVASTPLKGITSSPAAANLGIGVKLDDTGEKTVSNQSDCWHGWIDELAIFHRALTPEEIVALAERGNRIETRVKVPLKPDTHSGK